MASLPLLWSRFADACRARGPNTLLATPADERSGSACLALAEDRAARLARQGIGSGDRVLVAGGRANAYWLDMAALWRLGAVPVPLDPGMDAAQTAVVVRKAAATGVVGAALDGVAQLDTEGGVADRTALPSGLATGPEAMGALLFTSGSTGEPKGVALSHAALAGNSDAILHHLDLGADDRLFMAIPFHFTSAICHMLAVLGREAALIGTEDRPLMGDLVAMVRASGATCFGGSPLQLRWLADAGEPLPLRWVMSSGDHLGVDIIASLKRAQPQTRIVTVYGLTEVGGRFCILPAEELDGREGSVGRPIPHMRVSVRDENGAEVPVGEEGEVHADGPYLFDGYFGEPSLSAACTGPYGFRTGDLGRLDAEGRLWLSGRADDVFKSAGQKVCVAPIVERLMETGAFVEAAVVAMDHPVLGSVPRVLYVPRDPEGFKKGPVLRHLRATLPPTHIPQVFTPVDAIPRTGSGKIRRAAVRELVRHLDGG